MQNPLISTDSVYDDETVQSKNNNNLQLFSSNTENVFTPKKNNDSEDLNAKNVHTFEVENPQTSPITGTLLADSRSPLEAYCIDCKKNILTVPTFHTGRSTHIMGGLLCCLGFYCCCCCLPYHMKDCKDVRHACPYCDGIISIKKFTIL